jgi:hypothetical protein
MWDMMMNVPQATSMTTTHMIENIGKKRSPRSKRQIGKHDTTHNLIRHECRKVARKARSFFIQRLIRTIKKIRQLITMGPIESSTKLETRISLFEKRLIEAKVSANEILLNVMIDR